MAITLHVHNTEHARMTVYVGEHHVGVSLFCGDTYQSTQIGLATAHDRLRMRQIIEAIESTWVGAATSAAAWRLVDLETIHRHIASICRRPS